MSEDYAQLKASQTAESLYGEAVQRILEAEANIATHTTSIANNSSQIGNLSKSFSSSAPTTGTWGLADKVWNSAPVAGGNLGWICVQAGTFGTGTPPVFKQFGIISA